MEILKFIDVIANLSLGFTLISTILFWVSSLKNIDTLKFIGFYLILLSFTEISSSILFKLGENNLWLLHLYTLLELILLSFFYRRFLQKANLISWITIIASILIIGNSIFLQNIYGFNSNAKTLEQLIIITYSILFFFNFPTQTILDKTLAQSLNLINSAILIYFSGSLFIFMFSSYFQDSGSRVPMGFWAFNALLSLLFQLLMFISLWRIAFRKQISSNL